MPQIFRKSKKAKLLITYLLVFLLVLSGGCVFRSSPVNGSSNNASPRFTATSNSEILGKQSSSNIILNTVAVQAPDQVMVYKTLPTIVTKADGIAFAKKFNITDYDEIKEGDRVISVTSKDRRFFTMLYKNGGQSYWDSDRSDNPNGLDIIENLPSDEEAEKIATAFLKERDLLPEGAVFGGSKHNKAYLLNHSGARQLLTGKIYC